VLPDLTTSPYFTVRAGIEKQSKPLLLNQLCRSGSGIRRRVCNPALQPRHQAVTRIASKLSLDPNSAESRFVRGRRRHLPS
jgi:hypothetical protein